MSLLRALRQIGCISELRRRRDAPARADPQFVCAETVTHVSSGSARCQRFCPSTVARQIGVSQDAKATLSSAVFSAWLTCEDARKASRYRWEARHSPTLSDESGGYE